MRKAKDNRHVPTRYFRPSFYFCPKCGVRLKRSATVQDKVLTTLEGRFRVISRGYKCSRARCSNARVMLVSPEPTQLSLRGLSFGFDVIAKIGWWRFWEHRTLDEILELANRRFAISRRQIMYVIVDFLCLLKAAQPVRIEEYRTFYIRHGLLLSIDAMQPEKGNDVLYVVRELRSGLTLQAAKLQNQRAETIRKQVLKPINALGFKIRAIVSDAEDAIHQACQKMWPDSPQHACHFHALRDAGKPIYEADQNHMVKIKKELRSKLGPVRREIQDLDESNPYRTVLIDYAEAMRSILRVNGLAPFCLGGLRVLDNLRAVAASLRRCQKKKNILYWISCFLLLWYIEPMLLSDVAIADNWDG